MTELLKGLSEQWHGVLMLILLVVTGFAMLHYLAYIAKWGRWSSPKNADTREPLRYILGRFFENLINEFPHLLALFVLLIFFVVIVIMIAPGCQNGDVSQMSEGLKTVAATLGPFVATLVGFYYSETRSKRTRKIPASRFENSLLEAESLTPIGPPPLIRPEDNMATAVVVDAIPEVPQHGGDLNNAGGSP